MKLIGKTLAFVAMLVGRFDDRANLSDTVVESRQLVGTFLNCRRHGVARIHVSECDVRGMRHVASTMVR